MFMSFIQLIQYHSTLSSTRALDTLKVGKKSCKETFKIRDAGRYGITEGNVKRRILQLNYLLSLTFFITIR